MAKRELIDRIQLKEDISDLKEYWDVDALISNQLEISDQEIVSPYLTKLRSDIVASIEDIKGKYDTTVPEHDRPLCKCARNEARLEIIEWIDNLLTELGGK